MTIFDPKKTYTIMSPWSGKVFARKDDLTLVQRTFQHYPEVDSEAWILKKVGDDLYEIRSKGPGEYYLDGNVNKGSALALNKYADVDSQKWVIKPFGDWYSIICLDNNCTPSIQNNSSSDEAQIQLADFQGYWTQRWYIYTTY
jgi:hypothetical protein